MENAVKNHIPIHIDLLPNRDEVHSGICLKYNKDVYISICYNDDICEYDGFAIIRNSEIGQYRYWDDEEISEIRSNNFEEFLDVLPLDNMNTFYECLKVLTLQKLITAFTSDDDNSFYVGNITELTTDILTLKLISESAEWLDTKGIRITDITYIGFGSAYEKELIKSLV
ncbi:MAG: hypothetical protein N4A72_16295 [Bacteroidales bacterium]|jgi:hypothetical protein|nr:hypothetical protein [Bacteroidales bacterium]